MMTLASWKYPAIALLGTVSWLGIASARPLQDPPRAQAGQQAREEPQPQDPAPDPLARTVPRDLEVQPGSGTALVYALDDKGDRIEVDAEKAAARKEAIRKARGALDNRGEQVDEAANQKALKDALSLPVGPWKEVEAPLRWVAITGVVDNQGIREALALARKVELAEAFPKYRRLEVQRRVRSPEGDWSDWKDLDYDKNYQVLDHLPVLSPERTPEQVRPPALVDPLPFLTKGTWSGVDHERIVRLPKPRPDKVLTEVGRLPESPLLAIRNLDFTVEAGKTYRYRVRVLLVNPDKDKDRKRELSGPWSEPTKEVAVP